MKEVQRHHEFAKTISRPKRMARERKSMPTLISRLFNNLPPQQRIARLAEGTLQGYRATIDCNTARSSKHFQSHQNPRIPANRFLHHKPSGNFNILSRFPQTPCSRSRGRVHHCRLMCHLLRRHGRVVNIIRESRTVLRPCVSWSSSSLGVRAPSPTPKRHYLDSSRHYSRAALQPD